MEQTVKRVQSPYRAGNRKLEKNEKLIGYWSKFVIQTTISVVILVIFLYCRSVEAITTSSFWKTTTNMLESDISVEEMKKKAEWGIEKVKIIIPEFLELKEEPKNNTTYEETKNEELKEVDSDKIENQEDKDIQSILKATTVLRPVKGEISSNYGERIDPESGNSEVHTGVDYKVAVGTQVKSAITGTVVEVKKSNVSLGNFVRIKNSDIVTTYAHCSAIKVKEGDKVKQGDIIALSGNTGNSSGPHLHFEIEKDGRSVNPTKLTG
jgi:murein DD-endopeptidase MepM/ murein hydrolase activator NlpD